jgi:hypothetical protein
VRQRSGGSWFEASPGKKLVRPYLHGLWKPDVVFHFCNPSSAGGTGPRLAPGTKSKTLAEK